MAYTTPHTWTSEQATVALMNEINNNIKALFPVGAYMYFCRSATTSETLLDDVWLECNGVSVLRATYPDLNTLLSGLGYPFGTTDGTHMTLPDAQGRAVVSQASGGHVDVNGLGDSDGYTKTTRTPKHNSSASGGSLSGSPSISGAPGINDPGHAHGVPVGSSAADGAGVDSNSNVVGSVTSASATTGITATLGTLAVSAGTLAVSGMTVGPGGTRPDDVIPYLVGGVLFIKART